MVEYETMFYILELGLEILITNLKNFDSELLNKQLRGEYTILKVYLIP